MVAATLQTHMEAQWAAHKGFLPALPLFINIITMKMNTLLDCSYNRDYEKILL